MPDVHDSPRSGLHWLHGTPNRWIARIVDRVSPEPVAPRTHRLERALATMSATVIVAIPLIALPIGLILLISFIIVSGIRRQRAARKD